MRMAETEAKSANSTPAGLYVDSEAPSHMGWKRGLFRVSGAPPPRFLRTQPQGWPIGDWTSQSPDLFSERAAEAGNMVTERHQKHPQMRGIGSNEAASRTDTPQRSAMVSCAVKDHTKYSETEATDI